MSGLTDPIRVGHLRFLDVLVICILVICLACPILEMFDRWDHTGQTGQDSESTFVVLAVCAGAIIAFSSQTLVRELADFRLDDFTPPLFRERLEETFITSTISSVIGQSPPVLRI